MLSALRALVTVVLVVLVAVGTLFFLRGFVHARRQVIPAIVTPSIDYDTASNPSFWSVVSFMRELVKLKLGLLPPREPKAVALTFDDGPYAFTTPQLLDLLQLHRVKATFFVVGRDAQMQPQLLRRIAADGHELGNHSMTHASFKALDAAHITAELEADDRIITGITGVRTRLMRPPGGQLDSDRMRLVQKLGYTVVFDHVNPGDWREDNALRMYQFTLMHSINRAIILLHSGREITIRALPTILDAYRRKGYKFVTVSELAALDHIAIP